MKTLLLLLLALCISTGHAQFIQQGPKLVGTGSIGNAYQGISVAASADGNTALVGGYTDDANRGAAWVFVRNANGGWQQQGPKLVGTVATGSATQQGYSVGLSANGNTAIIGSPGEAFSGCAYIFTRAGTVWTQKAKLIGTGGFFGAQGISVAISADGNTALLGAYMDGADVGAVWIFIYDSTNSIWRQQGQKLVGAGAVGNAKQGISVALSANGNTAIWGGWWDNAQAGAAWVFTRTDTVWTQQGLKLVGTGAVGSGVFQGNSVSISGDGNTAAVAGYADNAQAGAVWIFTRNGGVWSQQGNKVVGTGGVGGGRQGQVVSLSSDGNTFLSSATYDNAFLGSAWIFTRTSGVWSQLGEKISGTGAVGQAQQGWGAALSGDGNTALLGGWRDNATAGAAWVFMRGGATFSRSNLNKPVQDNQTVSDTINVSTNFLSTSSNSFTTNSLLSSVVVDVNVTIDSIIHPNLDDLEISLIHLGVNDTIVYRVGGNGANLIGTTLNDSATIQIENGSAPFSGQFQPTKPLTQFNGLDASGAWVLKVFDRATGNTGTLQAWSLTVRVSEDPTSVSPITHEIPEEFQLMQNYPNPFNPSTKIRFMIKDEGFTSLKVYDMLGREIAILVSEKLNAGMYEVNFNADGLPSGMYFYKLSLSPSATRDPASGGQSGNYIDIKKMVLIK